MNWFSGFRTDFLRALSALGNSPSKGLFIDSCYIHCQTEMQETWLYTKSPLLANTVSACTIFSLLQNIWFIIVFPFISSWKANSVTCMHDILQTIAKAVGDWFYERHPFRQIDCSYPCNPTCRNRVFAAQDYPGI